MYKKFYPFVTPITKLSQKMKIYKNIIKIRFS